MKSIIVYYSFSGNTKQIASFLAEYEKEKNDVKMLQLRSVDEPDKFLAQAVRAFMRKKAKIEAVEFDLSEFDIICVGTPVWAFAPAPAINAFLKECYGLEGKKAVLFTTYGSGTGNERCLKYMQKQLERKGVKDFTKFSIQQSRVRDEKFVLSEIEGVFR